MVDQPSGTVTLVFTDIEGSTRLLHELGERAYLDALAEHRRVVREACDRHGGYEVDYEGDSFFYAFASADAAVMALREATLGLEPGPIRLRVGMHTGTPVLDPPKYVGLDVHLAARVMSVGYGGQVLLSRATKELVDGDVLDLGEHKLKDFVDPVWLFQLGREEFPPLRSLNNTNLPTPANSFLGRETELWQAELVLEASRQVTISGPGGAGKTRFAIELAWRQLGRFPNGVFWVPLAVLRDPALVAEAISQTLGAKEGLVEHIGERQMLLLIDNFEQVIEAAPELSRLTTACPGLSLLVTSRELLRVDGEVDFPLPPLRGQEAVELFCERARCVSDPLIEELCVRLDGLPLVIELAAARMSVFTPKQLSQRLGRRLDLLKGRRDADPRHQTLRATIQWSYDLLSEAEAALFRRLSVFAGGSTLETAEEAVGAEPDLLQSLVEKSLLRHTGDRFWMLETIREFSTERLETSSAAEESRARHAHYFLALAEEAQPHLISPSQKAWLDRLELEHANLRATIDWLAQSEQVALELRLVGALGRFWLFHAHLEEGRRRTEEALSRGAEQPAEARERALYSATMILYRLGDYERLQAYAQECFALCQALGDSERLARGLLALAMSFGVRGDTAHEKAALLKSAEIARHAGHRDLLSMALNNLGVLAVSEGDQEEARRFYEESLALDRELGDAWSSAIDLLNLAYLAFWQARTEDTEAPLHEAIEIANALPAPQAIIDCLELLAAAAATRADADRGGTLLGAAEILREETGYARQPPLPGRDIHERTRKLLAIHDENRVAAARAHGREMTLDQAVAFALSAGFAQRAGSSSPES